MTTAIAATVAIDARTPRPVTGGILPSAAARRGAKRLVATPGCRRADEITSTRVRAPLPGRTAPRASQGSRRMDRAREPETADTSRAFRHTAWRWWRALDPWKSRQPAEARRA